MIPACFSSPQFFSLAISKSNLLLATSCCCILICVVAASLHNFVSFLSNGMESVADIPTLKFWFALMSVRTGLYHVGAISPFCTASGIPSGPSTSISISIL